ncbi:hypothetical protein EZV73_07050 [Acidaminobacter sp. JC074]|uniref:hypothetical protein n=1 Tax=Acidaminobacter sp. JC074 TaxID=2530199 RepID=UPI001F0ED91D|nr:hypothetical protein [Acidaminobacter sp. JC074]MCH4887322.1 hypothetical protein [Acidaminobacter sp. JC074]
MRLVNLLKIGRLMVSVIMLVSIVSYTYMSKYLALPRLDLIVTSFLSVFVFLLGLQYHLEKKMGIVAMFLMIFSIMMLVMTILGFVL